VLRKRRWHRRLQLGRYLVSQRRNYLPNRSIHRTCSRAGVGLRDHYGHVKSEPRNNRLDHRCDHRNPGSRLSHVRGRLLLTGQYRHRRACILRRQRLWYGKLQLCRYMDCQRRNYLPNRSLHRTCGRAGVGLRDHYGHVKSEPRNNRLGHRCDHRNPGSRLSHVRGRLLLAGQYRHGRDCILRRRRLWYGKLQLRRYMDCQRRNYLRNRSVHGTSHSSSLGLSHHHRDIRRVSNEVRQRDGGDRTSRNAHHLCGKYEYHGNLSDRVLADQ
jgi:hypothetical protein